MVADTTWGTAVVADGVVDGVVDGAAAHVGMGMGPM
jgi:hypothetical protein